MPTTTFYLNQEADDSIQISHGYNLKNLIITHNGVLIGQVESKKELSQSHSFLLPNNRVLTIQLKRKWGIQEELEILVNGNPLPGSTTDPQQRLKQVMQVFYYLIAINAGLGLVALLTGFPLLVNLGLGTESIVTGLIYLGLAYLVKAKLWVGALYAAIGIMVLDSLLIMVFAAEMQTNPVMGFFIKIFLILILLKGIPALKQMRTARQSVAEAEFEIS